MVRVAWLIEAAMSVFGGVIRAVVFGVLDCCEVVARRFR